MIGAPAILWMLTLVEAGPVAAAPAAAPSEAGERPRFVPTGDAFFRYEAVRDAPIADEPDFERARLRLRPGGEAILASGRVALGAGLLASIASDSNDDNEIRRDNFISDEVSVDRAYVRLAGSGSAFTATLGVAPSPFGGTEVLWDQDLRFQGAQAGAELPPAGALEAQRLFGGVSIGTQDHEDESVTAAVRWEGTLARGLTVGGAFWHFDRTEALVEAGYGRTNRLAPGGEDLLSDFEVVNLTLGKEWLGRNRPVRVRLDVLCNPGADDRRWGGELRADWGELQERGTWRARLFLQRVEQDATVAAFGGDEWWFRTQQRGARAAFAVALHRTTFVEVSVLSQHRDGLDESLERAMIDVVFRH